MPTYQFKCKNCEANASVAVPITESDEIKAPKCFPCDKLMERIFSAPGLSFKGNGWGSDR